MADDPRPKTADPSDLIGVEFTIAVALAVLLTLGAFFFIGPVVGVIVLLAGGGIGAYFVVRTLQATDIED